MNHPDWFGCLLLVLAGFRTYRLAAEDTILNWPRRWLLGLTDWHPPAPAPDTYREKLSLWLTCPWCAGFWHGCAWWAAWWAFPTETLWFAAPWAITASLSLVATRLDAAEPVTPPSDDE